MFSWETSINTSAGLSANHKQLCGRMCTRRVLLLFIRILPSRHGGWGPLAMAAEVERDRWRNVSVESESDIPCMIACKEGVVLADILLCISSITASRFESNKVLGCKMTFCKSQIANLHSKTQVLVLRLASYKKLTECMLWFCTTNSSYLAWEVEQKIIFLNFALMFM